LPTSIHDGTQPKLIKTRHAGTRLEPATEWPAWKLAPWCLGKGRERWIRPWQELDRERLAQYHAVLVAGLMLTGLFVAHR
jgi:hypothetical protein